MSFKNIISAMFPKSKFACGKENTGLPIKFCAESELVKALLLFSKIGYQRTRNMQRN